MSFFNKLLPESKSDIAIKNLKRLGNQFMSGNSDDKDLVEWDLNLKLIKSQIINNFNVSAKKTDYLIDRYEDILIKYLLKHHPNDERLKITYSNDENIVAARNYLYREMTLLALVEIISLVHKWEFNSKEEYSNFIIAINEYVYFKNDNKSSFVVTQICNDLSDDALFQVLLNFKTKVPDYTKVHKAWHKKVDNLNTFKSTE